jgi:hypothetical protein
VLPAARTVTSAQRQAQQQARRRRQNQRRARRFESLLSQVPQPSLAGISGLWPKWGSTVWQPSHLLSLLLLLGAIGGIGWVHYDEAWYIYREHVTFTNVTYEDPDALYERLGIDGWNVFWLSSAALRGKLIALPTIDDVQVQITPPHSVTIAVTEATPVALWVTQEGDFWLLPDGTALAKLDDRYDQLPRLIDQQRAASLRSDPTQQRVDPDVLASALALLQQVPTIDNLYFNAGLGLNFHMPGSDTWVYWGDGSNADQKYTNLLAITQELRVQQEVASVVDIRFDKPVIR